MISINNIFRRWRRDPVSQSEGYWDLSDHPTGTKENDIFSSPSFLLMDDARRRNLLRDHDLHKDIQQKQSFANFVYKLVRLWVITLVFVILMQGFGGIWVFKFNLKTSEFIAVVTTTTATVFGLAVIVGRYLFGVKEKAEKNDNISQGLMEFEKDSPKESFRNIDDNKGRADFQS